MASPTSTNLFDDEPITQKEGPLVMIVEDSLTFREGFRDHLQQEGFQVIACATGEEALWRLRFDIPDCIVIDYELPGIFGDLVCKAIRTQLHLRDIPVFILTVKTETSIQIQTLDSGADDFLSKAQSMAFITSRIRQSLKKRGSHEHETTRSYLATLKQSHCPQTIYFIGQGEALHSLGIKLKSSSVTTTLFKSFSEGIQKLISLPPEIVVLDLTHNLEKIIPSLPKIRRLFSHDKVLLIGLIEHLTDERHEQLFSSGCDDLLLTSNSINLNQAKLLSALRQKTSRIENQIIFSKVIQMELEHSRNQALILAQQEQLDLLQVLRDKNKALENRLKAERERAALPSQEAQQQKQLLRAYYELCHLLSQELSIIFKTHDTYVNTLKDAESGFLAFLQQFSQTINHVPQPLIEVFQRYRLNATIEDLPMITEECSQSLSQLKQVLSDLMLLKHLIVSPQNPFNLTQLLIDCIKTLGQEGNAPAFSLKPTETIMLRGNEHAFSYFFNKLLKLTHALIKSEQPPYQPRILLKETASTITLQIKIESANFTQDTQKRIRTFCLVLLDPKSGMKNFTIYLLKEILRQQKGAFIEDSRQEDNVAPSETTLTIVLKCSQR